MFAVPVSCPSCHSELAPDARFCAACGRRVRRYPADMSWAVADRRTFGVMPGRSAFRSVRIRAVRLFGLLRAEIVTFVAILRAHVTAQRERFRLRRHAAALAQERSRALHRLGEAALYGDPQDVTGAKERVTGLDAELRSVTEELERVEQALRARVDSVKRDEGATEPAQPVPEPAPVPSDPPGPVIVPEPEPVPHEPPGPEIDPEPEPPTGVRTRRRSASAAK
jgi:hypothetical protein